MQNPCNDRKLTSSCSERKKSLLKVLQTLPDTFLAASCLHIRAAIPPSKHIGEILMSTKQIQESRPLGSADRRTSSSIFPQEFVLSHTPRRRNSAHSLALSHPSHTSATRSEITPVNRDFVSTVKGHLLVLKALDWFYQPWQRWQYSGSLAECTPCILPWRGP